MRKLVSLLILLLFVLPVSAQISTTEEVTMSPFMSETLDVQGLYPESWQTQETTPGVYLRARDPLDLTAIIMQARPGTASSFVDEVSTSFELTDSLEVIETIETNFFTWDIYQFERTQANQDLIVDMAVAEDAESGRVFYVLMQTVGIFYDNLHEQVFLPAVQWLSPIQRYEDPNDLFTVPVPTRWSFEATEEFGVMNNAEQTIIIYVDAVESDDPIEAMRDFWMMVNPNFDSTYEEADDDIDIIEDPARIGALESVIIIDWEDGTSETGQVLQSVARVHNGIVYMTLIVSDVETIRENDSDIALVDNNFSITALEALEDTTSEVTEEAGE